MSGQEQYSRMLLFVFFTLITITNLLGAPPLTLPGDLGDQWMFLGDSETAGRATDDPSALSQVVAFQNIWEATYGTPPDDYVNGVGGRGLEATIDQYESRNNRGTAGLVHFQESGDQNESGQRTSTEFGNTFYSSIILIDSDSPNAVISTETAYSFQRESENYRDWTEYNAVLKSQVDTLAGLGITVYVAEVDRNITALVDQLGFSSVITSDGGHYQGVGNLMVALSIYDAMGIDIHSLDLSGILDAEVSAAQKTACLNIIDGFNGSNIDPAADISSDVTTGEAPLEVQFDGSSSYDSDGTITGYAWDFGDGDSDSGSEVSHTYTSAGVFTVTLTVTDNEGAEDSDTIVITATVPDNDPPTAYADADITSGDSPLTVVFDGSGSSDPDGTIALYSWDFDDGSTGSGASVSHTFNSAGTFTVVLTVTDNQGASDSDSISISAAGNVLPNADIAVDHTSGEAPLTVVFSAGSSYDSDGSIDGYAWDFDDGSTGTGISPVHLFDSPGSYLVLLTVTDDDGGVDTETLLITVEPQAGASTEEGVESACTISQNNSITHVIAGLALLLFLQLGKREERI